MKKIICDKCGKEVFEEQDRPIFIGKACYKVDLCEECTEKWEKEGMALAEKYNAQIEELYEKRDQALMDLIGIDKGRDE